MGSNRKSNELESKEIESKEGFEERYKRARADYINLERRVRSQQEEFVKFANSVLVLKLLPVLDDLEKAASKADEGLTLVLKNFQEVLKSEGVEEIKVKKGDEFDPNIMEGLQHGNTEDIEAQKVIEVVEVIRKGYKMKEKILRPVQVKVGS